MARAPAKRKKPVKRRAPPKKAARPTKLTPKAKEPAALNSKQKRFVAEYLIDRNATQAAIRSGYSKKTAAQQAARLLKNVKVAALVEEKAEKQLAKIDVTAEKVLAELARIGFSDIRKAVKWFSQANIASVDEVEGEIEDGSIRFAVANQVELINSDQIDDDTAAAISEIAMTDRGGLKVKFHDKRAALVDLGRHLKLFTDNVDLTSGGKPLSLNDFYGNRSSGG